ncbi:MAG: efflux RND transporter periplasmic adaptor subunit [Wenzhouxiangella sp.]
MNHKLTAYAALLGLGLGLLSPAVQATDVIVAPAVRTSLSDPIEALGTLRAREMADITASITETISDIRFSDGERVQAGQVLAALTNREQLAELAAAEADLQEARRQYERILDLAERGQESRAMLDQRRRELETAQARLAAVEARLSDRLITAPFDGVLGLRNVSVGSLMTPGRVLATIVDDTTMQVDFAVPELLMAAVQPGLLLEAHTRAWPDEVFRGEVVSLSNAVDPVTRAFQVRGELPNPEGLLRPGMLMSVTVAGRQREAIVVPEEAILSRGRSHHVFVVERGSNEIRAHRRTVELGRRLPGQVEISRGLEADERVVIHGGFRLADGQAVNVRAEVDGSLSLAQILAGETGS